MYYYYKIQQKGRDIRRIPKHEDKLLNKNQIVLRQKSLVTTY